MPLMLGAVDDKASILPELSEAVARFGSYGVVVDEPPFCPGAHMDRQLEILVLEDSEADLFLLERHLRNNHLACRCHRVDEPEMLRTALNRQSWDLVLADCMMPRIRADEALALILESDPHLPVIAVSGTTKEEEAVGLLKAGAADFVHKERLARLVPAIERGLRDAEERRMRRQAERTLTTLLANLPGMAYRCLNDTNWTMLFVSDGGQDLTGYSPEAFMAGTVSYGHQVIHPGERERVWTEIQTAVAKNEPFEITYRIVAAQGAAKWVWERGCQVAGEGGDLGHEVLEGFITDVTLQRLAAEALHASQAQLRGLAARIEEAREGERRAIAQEIHDELGQVLTGLRLDLGWFASRLLPDQEALLVRIQESDSVVESAVATVRNLCSRLRPTLLDNLGVEAAIEWEATQCAERTGCRYELNLRASGIDRQMRRDTAVYRILQEALTNVMRHARAKKFSVRLFVRDAMLILEVQDDGVGISAEQADDRGSLGLAGMRERAHALGGYMDIEGAAGGGALVRAAVPLMPLGTVGACGRAA
jgi:two-component system sensor histidine kinase UhpB